MRGRALYLRPLNGLCNRMRAIASAHALAEAVGTRLTIFWDINPDVGAPYEAIFQPTDHYEVINVCPKRSLRETMLFLLYSELKSLKGIPVQWITRWYFRDSIFHQVRPRDFADRRLEQIVKDAKRTLITSWWSFYGEPSIDFSIFALHAAQQAEVDRIACTFDRNTVGVHIRRTDNANALRYSPTSSFVAAMKDVIVADPGVRFFLATDDADTEHYLTSQFGNAIITRPRKISRSSAEGLRDAAVDLFLLSRTSRILGSFYSTFSETAASIGGIDWVTVTDDPSLVGKCNTEVLVTPRKELQP